MKTVLHRDAAGHRFDKLRWSGARVTRLVGRHIVKQSGLMHTGRTRPNELRILAQHSLQRNHVARDHGVRRRKGRNASHGPQQTLSEFKC